eukprot:TRINITY_DN23612_c0_g1_i1.p1 TRINITY_DN23612_c0_g1~~TRINITY_DN23612_c0_g1_i1.p1  ORF type:complete len:503 (+),score=109.71 TRINITY_DN23612_c0_g1_i1:83-1591(+)
MAALPPVQGTQLPAAQEDAPGGAPIAPHPPPGDARQQGAAPVRRGSSLRLRRASGDPLDDAAKTSSIAAACQAYSAAVPTLDRTSSQTGLGERRRSSLQSAVERKTSGAGLGLRRPSGGRGPPNAPAHAHPLAERRRSSEVHLPAAERTQNAQGTPGVPGLRGWFGYLRRRSSEIQLPELPPMPGVEEVAVSKEPDESVGLVMREGCIVHSVVRGGPADRAGLARFAGRRLTHVDGKAVLSPADMPANHGSISFRLRFAARGRDSADAGVKGAPAAADSEAPPPLPPNAKAAPQAGPPPQAPSPDALPLAPAPRTSPQTQAAKAPPQSDAPLPNPPGPRKSITAAAPAQPPGGRRPSRPAPPMDRPIDAGKRHSVVRRQSGARRGTWARQEDPEIKELQRAVSRVEALEQELQELRCEAVADRDAGAQAALLKGLAELSDQLQQARAVVDSIAVQQLQDSQRQEEAERELQRQRQTGSGGRRGSQAAPAARRGSTAAQHRPG